MLKYKFLPETKTLLGVVLRRIQALRDFRNQIRDVKAGDVGGWLETEDNLSQEGNCWVYEDASVYGAARVSEDAGVCKDARVFEEARVYGEAQVSEEARVFGNARVFDTAHVYGEASVLGSAKVYGDAEVFGHACVFDDARVFGESRVSGHSQVFGHACVFDDAWVYGDALVYGEAQVFGRAGVNGEAAVDGPGFFHVVLSGYAITYDGHGWLSIGCKRMDVEQWKEKWREVAKDTGPRAEEFAKKYRRVILELIKAQG